MTHGGTIDGVLKLAGAAVVCAAAAFAAAFFAAGAASNVTKRATPRSKPVPFADSAARAVSFTGTPAALKLPPPKRVKHRKRAVAVSGAPPVSPPASTAASVTPTVPPAPRHKSSSGHGHGVTIVGGP